MTHVLARKDGYYDDQLKRVGDSFKLKAAGDFSENWMEKVSAAESREIAEGRDQDGNEVLKEVIADVVEQKVKPTAIKSGKK